MKKTLIVMGVLGLAIFGFMRLGNSFQQIAQQAQRGHTGGKAVPLFPEDREAIALLREIVNTKDKGRIQEVFKRLDHQSERVRAASALAVGRLAAHEGKDKLEKLCNSRKQDGPAAKIALARLSAESSGANAPEKVRSFLSSLGVSVAQLNRLVKEEGHSDIGPPFGALILREIADMVAEANRRGLDTSALEREIDLGADYLSALKVRLSKMNQSKRIAYLIQYIRTQPGDHSYEAQALADEGSAAVPAVIVALQEIHDEIKRNGSVPKRSPHLIFALAGIGDRRALPILRTFVDQPGTLYGKPDHFIQSYAHMAIRYIHEGKKYCMAIDY